MGGENVPLASIFFFRILLNSCPAREKACRVCSYLVAQTLGGNDGDLIADALVGLEVESETRVVALNDDLGRLLDSLSPDATHFDRCVGCWVSC